MKLFNLFIVFTANLRHVKSETTRGQCDSHMRLVNAKFLAEETLYTKAGISNGEPFLNRYLNQTRFVQEVEPNCAKACFKHPDCFGTLTVNGCELGLSNITQGRQLTDNSEQENVMIKMSAFLGFIEDISDNKALGKPAYASSSMHNNLASWAVDGFYNPGPCTHTSTNVQRRTNQWWAVDLEANHTVYAVSVVNREGVTASRRLHNFDIFVSTDNHDPFASIHKSLCAHVVGPVGVTAYETFTCEEPLVGRYAIVLLPTDFLSLCEVEVFAIL